MRRRGLVSQMYAAARLANDISTVASGNPNRIARACEEQDFGTRNGPDGDLADAVAVVGGLRCHC